MKIYQYLLRRKYYILKKVIDFIKEVLNFKVSSSSLKETYLLSRKFYLKDVII